MKFLLFLLIVCGGCAPSLEPPKINSTLLTIERVTPGNGDEVQSPKSVDILFSSPILPQSITPNSLFVKNSKKENVVGSFLFSPDDKIVSFIPEVPFQESEKYILTLKRLITTPDYFPLVTENEDDYESQFLIISPGVNVTGDGDSINKGSQSSAAVALHVRIQEIYYDPPGNEEDGAVFIELSGESGASLDGFRVKLVNGADGKKNTEVFLTSSDRLSETGLFVIADAMTGNATQTLVAKYDLIKNLNFQNGPDSIQVYGRDGQLMDALGYGALTIDKDEAGFAMYEGAPAIDVGEGVSLVRVGEDTNNNAHDFLPNPIPSPGFSEVIISKEEDENIPVFDEENEEEEVENDNLVIISEVVVDPQRDWNDTESENGLPFDIFFGSGTVGPTDEWIELKNVSTSSVEMSGWKLLMIDGSDAVEELDSPSGTFVFSMEGSVEEFKRQEVLVIGNPAGDMKNQVLLQLLNEDDLEVDSVFVEDGNADSFLNESFFKNEQNIFEMGEATIGF